MPTYLSSYARNAFVNWRTGANSMPAATTRYIALFNGDPTSGGSEITATVCTNRKSITGMSVSSGGAKSSTNSANLIFTTSASGTGTWNYIGVYDASSGGNLLWYKDITSRTIAVGNGIAIDAGDLIITSANPPSNYSADRLVNWMTGSNSFPATTTRYLAFYSGTPSTTFTEVTSDIVSGGRQAVTSVMPLASSGSSTNNSDVAFGTSVHGNTVSYLVLLDSSSSGNIIDYAPVSGGSHFVPAGFAINVPSGSLTISAA